MVPRKVSQRGISRLTILLVLAGLLVLGSGVIYLWNPLERQREARDKKRLEDIEILVKAVSFYLRNNVDNPRLCESCKLEEDVFSSQTVSLVGSSVTVINSEAVSGSGWVPIDFSLNAGLNKTPILALPADPKNQDPFVYTFSPAAAGRFKFTARFESNAYQTKMVEDGGKLDDRFEAGTDLSLPPN